MDEPIIPDDLVAAATKWEKKFQARNIESRKIDRMEWAVLHPELRRLVPQWQIELLAKHALIGPCFKKTHNGYPPWPWPFGFWPIWCYKERMANLDSYKEDIIEPGFVPIGDSMNGDLWVVKQAGDFSTAVYLYDLSGREIKEIEPNMARFLNHLKLGE